MYDQFILEDIASLDCRRFVLIHQYIKLINTSNPNTRRELNTFFFYSGFSLLTQCFTLGDVTLRDVAISSAFSLPPLSSGSVSCFLCFSYWENVNVVFTPCQSAAPGWKCVKQVQLKSLYPGSVTQATSRRLPCRFHASAWNTSRFLLLCCFARGSERSKFVEIWKSESP